MAKYLSFTFSLFFILSYQQVYAQSEIWKTVVVTQEHDSLRGYLYISKENEYLFSEASTQKGKPLSPKEVNKILTDDNTVIESKKITLNEREQWVFLKLLVKGESSLYQLAGHKESAYWVITDDGTIYPLTNEKKEFQQNGNHYVRYTNTYRGVLKNIFQNDPALYTEIDKLKYQEASLINIYKKYHSQNNIPLEVYQKGKKDVVLKWGIMAGMQFTSLKFIGTEELESYLSPTFSNSSNFSFGFFTEAQPVKSRHSAFKIAFQYQSAFYSNPTLSLSTNILRVSPAYKYVILPNAKLKPYISLGPAFNFLLSLKDQSIYDELDRKWLQSGRIQYGLEAVAGVSKGINDKHSIFLELRYGVYNGNHLTSSQRFVVGVGYVPIQDSFDSISNSIGVLGGFTF